MRSSAWRDRRPLDLVMNWRAVHMEIATSRNRRSWALVRTFLHLLRLLAARRSMTAVSAKKDIIMKLFGTVKTFDETKGFGTIKPEAGGDDLRFEKSAV